MTGVQVGRVMLNISADVFEAGDRKGTIIDSGTTLAYLPELIYEPLVTMVLNNARALSIGEPHYKCEMSQMTIFDFVLSCRFSLGNTIWKFKLFMENINVFSTQRGIERSEFDYFL